MTAIRSRLRIGAPYICAQGRSGSARLHQTELICTLLLPGCGLELRGPECERTRLALANPSLIRTLGPPRPNVLQL